ncbi:MAG: type I methionyl aminopeptidase [Chloroflexi bacterium]|nr:type I methionyl aminopeptidase [Chloroflexota bacterium]HEV8054635.1 type I methionyl aminopeptidase [Candidatus Limnocylindrales bacterium]
MLERRVALKSSAQIERMAVAGRLVAEVLDRLEELVRPGVTTRELDAVAERLIREAGAIPSFVGVPGPRGAYRHATCISIDDEVVHGIPGPRRVEDGQIVSVDAGAIVEGWHGDAARTFVVGDVPDETSRLVELTRRSMDAGIAAARPGAFLSDISAAIEDVALAAGYGVVRQFVGHGIGTEMHEEPQVANFRTGSRGRRLEPGLCLAIEPMFTLGGHEVAVGPDGWTVATVDGSLAAHWEHSIAITEDGPRVLTIAEPAAEKLPQAVGL